MIGWIDGEATVSGSSVLPDSQYGMTDAGHGHGFLFLSPGEPHESPMSFTEQSQADASRESHLN